MTPDTDDTQLVLAEAVLVLGVSAVIMVVVAVVIVRAAKHPMPTAVVLALTLLGALALVGYSVAGEARAELAAIAGTAVGALAGGVASLLSRDTEQ